MRNLVAYVLLSLDGVAEEPADFISEFDDVMRENLKRVIEAQDLVVLGRRTYDEWSAFWPTSEIEPFATFINGVDKLVVTSTPLETSWSNTTVVDGSALAALEALKQGTGGDIGIHGSIQLTQFLLGAGQIDTLRLVVAPALSGGGRRLFEGAPSQELVLLRSVTSPSGSLLVDYAVTR